MYSLLVAAGKVSQRGLLEQGTTNGGYEQEGFIDTYQTWWFPSLRMIEIIKTIHIGPHEDYWYLFLYTYVRCLLCLIIARIPDNWNMLQATQLIGWSQESCFEDWRLIAAPRQPTPSQQPTKIAFQQQLSTLISSEQEHHTQNTHTKKWHVNQKVKDVVNLGTKVTNQRNSRSVSTGFRRHDLATKTGGFGGDRQEIRRNSQCFPTSYLVIYSCKWGVKTSISNGHS